MSRTRLRRSRRPIEKLVLFILALATAGGFLGSFVIGYAVWQLDQVERFAVHDVLTAPVREPVTASDLIAIAASETERADNTLNDDKNQPLLPPAVAKAPVDDDRWSHAWLRAGRRAAAAWSDDAVLGQPMALPWIEGSGAEVLASYFSEVTVHTWDLATATGQRPDWDDAVVAAALEGARRILPAENRRALPIEFVSPQTLRGARRLEEAPPNYTPPLAERDLAS